MEEKKIVKKTVEDIVENLKSNKSSRFSKEDFKFLIYGILSDKDFNVKKHLIKNNVVIEEDLSINTGFRKFLNKLLKHAGMNNDDERENIIDTFEYNANDIEWITDCVDEAMFIYTECGKNMRIFRDKMLQLSIKKMTRSGKFEGAITYKKTVSNKLAAMEKKHNKSSQ